MLVILERTAPEARLAADKPHWLNRLKSRHVCIDVPDQTAHQARPHRQGHQGWQLHAITFTEIIQDITIFYITPQDDL